MSRHLPFARLAAAGLALLALGARAALTDKIEVDEGDVQKEGSVGVKLHLNATPSGREDARFEGEIVAAHGWRVTPELTYGLARDVEVGVTLPFVHGPGGVDRSAGARAAVKWNPLHPAEGATGATASVQLEYGRLGRRFQEETRVLDVVPILSWHDESWLAAANPVLEFAFTGPGRGSRPSFDPALKVSRRVAEGFWIGTEYFGGLGPLGRPSPRSGQSHTLYLALDVDREPWAVNFGVGRGLNAATDRWTVKAIVDLPF
jgi:hypothetical protein